MKHIRNFNGFKSHRMAAESAKIADGYYYSKGKASTRSMLEMELISEGYSSAVVSAMNEGNYLHRIDKKIIDCLYEYVSLGSQEKLDLLTEEINLKQGFKDLYGKVTNVIDKGIEIGKTAITSFGNFLKNIGNVIKSLFGKIKAFFMKIWELFKPAAMAAGGMIKKAIGGGSPEKMGKAVETISSDQGQTEIDSLTKDFAALAAKFKTGDVGNTSPETEEKLKGEAEEYKDVVDDQEIESLMKESVTSKGAVKRIFYSIKGFLAEGGTVQEMEKVFEAEEKKEEWSAKEGEIAAYTNEKGEEVERKILRIEGENAVFQKTKGDGEYTKKVSDLREPKEGMGKKLLHGFVGEEPEKKGIFGWLVEAVGSVIGWQAKLWELAYRGGSNGILTLISAMARKSWKNATKFVVMGVVVGLVYHIIHGIAALAGGHEGGHEGEEGHGKEGQGKEGGVQVQVEAPKKGAAPVAAAADTTAAAVKPAINLKKESLDSIFEDAAATDSGKIDMNKESKLLAFFKWENLKGVLLPVVGSLMVSVISLYWHPLHKVMEGVLVTIGVFELLGALCKTEWVAKTKLKVCSVQHSIHHALEGAAGGKAAH